MKRRQAPIGILHLQCERGPGLLMDATPALVRSLASYNS